MVEVKKIESRLLQKENSPRRSFFLDYLPFSSFLFLSKMSSVLSFDVLISTLRSATPDQQWEFKTFVESITKPAPPPAPPAPAPKAKEKKKVAEPALVIAPAEEDKLLAPVDVPACGAGTAPVVTAPTYRLAVVNPSLCMARKIDKKAPIPGTRPEDAGSNGKFYPELQCSKKPLAGSKLCKICSEKHAEAMKPENKNKAIESYYGLLDDVELYWNSQIIGSEKFIKKYPKGLPTISNTVVANPAPAPVPVAPVPVAEAPVAVPEKKKQVRKATKAKEETTAVATEPSTRKVRPLPAEPATSEEWELFLYEGRQYIRHKTTHNCYLTNGEEHELVRMVRRDAYEGKWRDGDLDRYAQEDEA